jgi:hypothetical protein
MGWLGCRLKSVHVGSWNGFSARGTLAADRCSSSGPGIGQRPGSQGRMTGLPTGALMWVLPLMHNVGHVAPGRAPWATPEHPSGPPARDPDGSVLAEAAARVARRWSSLGECEVHPEGCDAVKPCTGRHSGRGRGRARHPGGAVCRRGGRIPPGGGRHRQPGCWPLSPDPRAPSTLPGAVLSGVWPPAASLVQYALFGQEQCLLQSSQSPSVQ